MIRLLSDKVAIVPISDSDKTSSGLLYIPDMAKERADQGIVKYIGPKVKELKIGDYVLIGGYDGTTVQLEKDGDDVVIIMRERFVKAVLGAPDTEVKGVFFKTKRNQEDVELLKDALTKFCNNWRKADGEIEEEAILDQIIALFEVHNQYFPATYEMVMNLIAESFRDSDFARNTGFKKVFDSKPSYVSEYDKDEEDDEEETHIPLASESYRNVPDSYDHTPDSGPEFNPDKRTKIP